MAEVLSFLHNLFYTLGVVAVCACFVLLIPIYRRLQRGKQSPARNPQDDLINTMILFQTMRDVLRQQRDLAHRLNESVDRKVALIKQTVSQALDDHDKLCRGQREFILQLTETKTELAGVQRQLAYLQENPVKAASNAPHGSASVSEVAVPAVTGENHEPSGPSLEALARPEESSPDGDLIDNWVGLDFGSDQPEPDMVEAPEEAPKSPEDPEAAREAFRALLNIDLDRPAAPAQAPVEKRSGNGRTRITPVQGRVYEYSDAGMTVPQIARELGIGKGEVRLILSLRQDKER